MKFRLWLSLLPLTLAACSHRPSTETAANPSAATSSNTAALSNLTATPRLLTRYHWQLHDAVDSNNQRLDGLFEPSGKPLQLDFTDVRVSVSNACNGISGDYRIVDGQLVTGPLMQTMMACADPGLMQRETTIKNVLQAKPTVIASTADGKPMLTLSAVDGQSLTFSGQPTAQTRYGSPGKTEYLEVAAEPVDCPQPLASGVNCLQVRELHYDAQGQRVAEPGAWRTLMEPIEGYEHEAGVRNVLRVTRYTVANAPAGTSSLAYELETVVESETVAANKTPTN